MTIFYAWQSDLPKHHNLDLIEAALESAAESVRNDPAIAWQPSIDRDTKGVPGSPNVPDSIFQKIAKAAACVFDVSIVNRGSAKRHFPNPNVMLELGYALHAHSLDRIFLVFNTAHGEPRELPFDIGRNRLILYSADDSRDLKAEQLQLASELRDRLCESYSAATLLPTNKDVARLMAVLRDKVREILSGRDTTFLWANRDTASGYAVLTEPSRRNLIPPRDLRKVLRYDPVQFRITSSAFPDEAQALTAILREKGQSLLPPSE